MSDLKENRYWTIRKCKQCEKEFNVRKCYTKRGGGMFCSKSCSMTYRNITNNPTNNPETRLKISKNHADVSGKNNPMYGVRGKGAPSYIDGRNSYNGEVSRKIALANMTHICKVCGEGDISKIDVHHIDKDRRNNDIDNLMLVCSKCHQNILHPRARNDLGQFI